jgi:hypothetical protein
MHCSAGSEDVGTGYFGSGLAILKNGYWLFSSNAENIDWKLNRNGTANKRKNL